MYCDEDDLQRLLTKCMGKALPCLRPKETKKYHHRTCNTNQIQEVPTLWSPLENRPKTFTGFLFLRNSLCLIVAHLFKHRIFVLLFNLPLAIISLLCVPSFLFFILFIYLKLVFMASLWVTDVEIYLYDDAAWRPTLDAVPVLWAVWNIPKMLNAGI